METLIRYSQLQIANTQLDFKRYLLNNIDWSNRLISVVGARGVGKTTLLLQHLKDMYRKELDKVLYASLDDLYFSKHTIVELAEEFIRMGGKVLVLDEVHKYDGWSREVKNAYDYFPELKMIITGSSALDIYKGEADLSRRAVTYHMNGMSFREYIAMYYKTSFPAYQLPELLDNAYQIASEVNEKIKPVKLFKEYLQHGYYPFYKENHRNYYTKTKQVVNQILETDLSAIEKVPYSAVYNMKKLLAVITELAPFKPNVAKLSSQIEISRITMVKYLYLLSRADLLMLLQKEGKGDSQMAKPEKVYLNNTNLIYALCNTWANEGAIRETFFMNQLSQAHKVVYSEKSDFMVNGITLEIGGRNKSYNQIKDIENSYIAADDLEFPIGKKIPLWMFGLLY